MTTLQTATPTRQLVLPGQAGAPDGPVDLTVMFVVHHAFRRDLAAFAAAAAATPSEDRGTWRALARRWELFSSVLHHHHTGEDTGIWPALVAHAEAAGDTDALVTLAAMEAEHAEIDPLLQSAARGFARLSEHDDEQVRHALAVTLAAAREHLTDHLRHEECDALRILQSYLTQEEWDRLEEEHFKTKYTFREQVRVIAWVMHELPPVGVERLTREPQGKVLLVLWKALVRRGFERRERRAFRYLAA